METIKLYYEDAFVRQFDAAVTSCEEGKNGWAVVLDGTAFYPEGGGQPADHGTLGGVNVLDVHEKNGIITHTCDGPLTVGETVRGAIDWARRFDHMQQHSGEHIVSGMLCSTFHCDNVGFHLGADTVIIDYNADIPWEGVLDGDHFAPMCIPSLNFGDLPAPTHIWWLGKRESIDEYRSTTITHLRPSARKGDLMVRYEATPKRGITGFWRVLSNAIVDPIDPQYTYCYVGNRLDTPLLTSAELKADAYFSKHPLCKRHFLDSDGRMISEADLKQLLSLLQAKGFDCKL